LGRKLVRAGVISDSQLRDALVHRAKGIRPLGEALVADGLAVHPQISAALEEQVEDAVASLLGSHPTQFEWRSGTPDEAPVMIDADLFLSRVGSRLRQMEEIRTRLPTDDLRVTLNPLPPGGTEALTVTHEEWRVLAMLGARRSIHDLVRYSAAGDLHTLRTIDELVTSGLLEIASRNPARAPEELSGFPRPSTPPPKASPVPYGVRVEGASRGRVIRLEEPPPPPSERFRIAVVSSCDRTRGPLAAMLLMRATEGLPVTISSYGTLDVSGAPPTLEAIRAGEHVGVDLASYRSMPLGPGVLSDTDLVLGFEHEHLRAAVGTGGAPPAFAFTMLELLTLLGSIPPGDLGAIGYGRLTLRLADQARAGAPLREEDLELGVPTSEVAVDNLARFIEKACLRLRSSLFGVGDLEKSGK
jgi:protein-tyrosine-phosphatase